MPENDLRGHCLAVDFSDSDVLYMGGMHILDSRMVMARSTDRGESWSVAYLSQDYGSVYGLAIDPVNRGTLYAGGYSYDDIYLSKSTDGGSSWFDISGVVDNTVSVIAIDPSNANVLYCGISNGIYKSTNGGSSWVLKGDFSVETIAINPCRSYVIWAGGTEGTYLSNDGGEHWSSMTAGLSVQWTGSLAIDPLNPGMVYVGTLGAGVYGRNVLFDSLKR